MKQILRQATSALLVLCMLLTFIPFSMLTAHAEQADEVGTTVLNMDFEDQAPGTTADSLGWSVVTGDAGNSTPDDYSATVKQDGDNRVLAVQVNVTDAERKTHDIFVCPFGQAYDALTLTYRFKLSATGAVFYLPSLGTGTSQLVCLAVNAGGHASAYQKSDGSWAALQATEDGANYTDVGTYAANQWYTVKMVYEKTESGMNVDTYLDGKLTNATAKLTGTFSMENILFFMTKWSSNWRVLSMDDIKVTVPGTGEPEFDGILNLDFEDTAAGTKAVDAGWTISGSDACTAEVQNLQGNQVLALKMDTADSSRTDHVILQYPLGQAYDKLTLSYNIAFTNNGGVFYLPSLGRGTSQLACLATNAGGKSLAYQPSTGGWTGVATTEDGETYSDFGTYETLRWYTVKMVYEKTESGITATVYLDGKLTNASAKMTGSLSMENIVLFLTKWMGTNLTVYVDNFCVTAEDHVPAVPAALVQDTVAFNDAAYSVTVGKTVQTMATLTPASAAEQYAFSYRSSNEGVARVDESGLITGVAEGNAVITVCAANKADPRIQLTARTAVTVLASSSSQEVYRQNFDGLESLEDLTEWTVRDTTNGDACVEIADDPSGSGKVLALSRTGLNAGAVDITLNGDVFTATGKAELSYRFQRTDYSTIYAPSITSSAGRMVNLIFDGGGMHYQKNGNHKIADIGDSDWHTVKLLVDAELGKWFLYLDGAYVPVEDNALLNNGNAVSISIITLSSASRIPTIYFDDFVLQPMVETKAIEFDNAPSEIVAGIPTQFKLKVTPANASLSGAVFTSSDETVATVDENGYVTGLKDGKTTITATPLCGLPAVSAEVTVKVVHITEIQVTEETLVLPVDGHQFLHVTTVPEVTTDSGLLFTSSDETVATVDEWGEVMAVGAGKATVTAAVASAPDIFDTVAVTVTEAEAMDTIYVSPTGSASGNGTRAQPVSLDRALELIAEKNDNMTGNIEVILADGYYYRSEALEMTEAHGGTNQYSIVWKAAEGAEPVIGGAYEITGSSFTPYDGDIYVVSVPEWLDSRQLYVNNVRATRARSEGGLTNAEFLMDGDTNLGYICEDTALASFSNPSDLELVFKEEWTQPRIGVSSIALSGDGRVELTLDQPGWFSILNKGQTKAKSYGPVWYENALELLDEPGEWYLDTSTHKLYYMPRPFENLSEATVTIPTVDGELLTITGSGYEDTQMVQNVRFEGITFADTTWLRPNGPNGHSDAQNNHLRDYGTTDTLATAAVLVQRANGVHFEGCTFARIGINALQMREAVQNCTVIGNHFYDISSDAVNVGQPYANENVSGNKLLKNFEISNNYIHNTGVEFGSSAAISFSWVTNLRSSHNEIFNMPYSGYHIGYGWNIRFENTLKNAVVSQNFIHDYMGEGIYDGGAVYTLGNSSGEGYNYVSENYIRNQMNRTGVLYADQGTTFWKFTNNVVDLSESPLWEDGDAPVWAFINMLCEHVEYSDNYSTTKLYGNSTLVDFSENGVQMKNNTTYDPANPTAEVQQIIDASGLEPAYASLRGSLAERVSTNLSGDDLMLDVGQTFNVTIHYTDGKDKPVTGGNQTFAFDVADEAVATVSTTGLVTAVGAGTTKLRIYVVSNNILTQIEKTIVVGDTLQELLIDGVEDAVSMSSTSNGTQMQVMILTANGRTITPDRIEYSFADSSVAEVTADGLLRPLAVGETTLTITAYAGSHSISKIITVTIREAKAAQEDNLWEIFDEDRADDWTKVDYGSSTWTLVDGESITAKLNGYATFAGTVYHDELMHFKLTIDDSTGGGAWPAIVLRAESDANYVSADNIDGYMLCLAGNGIEVYRFNDGIRYLIYSDLQPGGKIVDTAQKGGKITDSPWTLGEEHDIQVGAVVDGDDVRLLLYIDGEEVINCLDRGTDKAITTPGFFGLIGRGETFTLRKVSLYDNMNNNLWEIFRKENEPAWKNAIGAADTWELVDGEKITTKFSGYSTFTGTKYNNELMHFYLTIDASTGGGGWPAIVLRATSDESYVSADNVGGYMFCLARGGVDVFRFVDGVRYVIYSDFNGNGKVSYDTKQGGTIKDSEWSLGEEHEIQVGAIADGDDVHLLLLIDGEEVVNYLDLGANKAITAPGYFGVIGRGETFTLRKVQMTDAERLAVQHIIELIDAIGEVTLDSKPAIDAAREAYDGLTEEQKTLVSNYEDLLAAEQRYEVCKAEDDQAKADAVIAKIRAIPTPVIKDSREAIEDARNAYDALTEAQKQLISDEILKQLTDAEEALKDLDKPEEQDIPVIPVLAGIPDRGQEDSTTEAVFRDIKPSDWYYEAVHFVVKNGLMKGTGSDTFSPDMQLTRGMIVTILYRLEEEPAGRSACPFADVATGSYYEKAIAWAAENGIVNGYSTERFGPDDMITREQLAAILYRYLGQPDGGKALNGYADANSVSDWAQDALGWAVSAGLISGMGDGTLNPKGVATRAQTAVILERMLKTVV